MATTTATPQSYRRQIARLKRRVIELEAQLGVKPSAVREAKATKAEAIAHRCDECGAEPGFMCRTPNDATRQPHHVRGRTERCDRQTCGTCDEFFDVKRAEALS